MSESTDTYTVSFKAGPQYKEALVVARGDTKEELEHNILELQETTLALVAETQALFLTAAALHEAPAGPVATVTPLPTQAAAVGGRSCPHGARTRRDGTNSRGAWVGWYCPLPKGTPGQCKTEFE